MRVVLVHDFLTQFGGAERVLKVLVSLFPEAPIYTLVYNEEIVRKHFPGREVRGSFLQSLPKSMRARPRLMLPLYPYAIGILKVRDFDVVISSSSAFAKGVQRGPHALHICYCHATARFLWEEQEDYLKDNHYNRVTRWVVKNIFTPFLRYWDIASSKRVDVWIANSAMTKRKIAERYKKDAIVIYPPLTILDQGKMHGEHHSEYFLVVSRLAAYKKIDIVVDAFNALGLPLVIVGEGPERKRLEKIARSNIEFRGFIEDDALAEHYAGATALIVACEEDFGMSAIEALSFGAPVLSIRKGGVMEWMEEGKTGEFFSEQTSQGICEGVKKILHGQERYDHAYLREVAGRFSKDAFITAMLRSMQK